MERVVDESPFPVRIRISYRLVEDSRLGDLWGMVLEQVPEGFEVENEEFGKVALVGSLGENGIDLLLRSEPHNADWSGEFLPLVERLEEPEANRDD